MMRLRQQAMRLRPLSPMNSSIKRSVHQSATPAFTQSLNQSMSQSVSQPNRSIMIASQPAVESCTRSQALRQSINQALNESANKSNHSSVDQSSRTYVSWTTSTHTLGDWTSHSGLRDWILDKIRLCRPSRVHLCDGSAEENAELIKNMVHSGVLTPLDQSLRPNSYVARSTTSDVARIEEKTFICSEQKSDSGFTNNWAEPEEMMHQLNTLFDSCMRGRTMYVVPFCMGPLNSEFSMIGVQITDSPYVVVNMRSVKHSLIALIRLLID
jgi:hypothetical protein